MTAPVPNAHIAVAGSLAALAVAGWLVSGKLGGITAVFAETPMTNQEFGDRLDALIKEKRAAEDACHNYDPVQRRSGVNPLCIQAVIEKYSVMMNNLQDERNRRNKVSRSTAQMPQVPDTFYGNTPIIHPCIPSNSHAPQTFSYYGCR